MTGDQEARPSSTPQHDPAGRPRATRQASTPVCTDNRRGEVGARTTKSVCTLNEEDIETSFVEGKHIPHYTEVVKLKKKPQAADYNKLMHTPGYPEYLAPQAQNPGDQGDQGGRYSSLNKGSPPPIPPPLSENDIPGSPGSPNEAVYYNEAVAGLTPQQPEDSSSSSSDTRNFGTYAN